MEQRMLTAKEIEIRETIIRILEKTLLSLEQNERVIVKQCILRMKNEITETVRRSKEYESRKANKMRKFLTHRCHTEKPSG